MKVDWKTAKKACRLFGGELAYVNNEAEMEYFNSSREGLNRFDWMGIRRNKRGTKWINIHRKEQSLFSLDQSELEGKQNCVQSKADNSWSDADCDMTREVVCRFEDAC